MYTLYRSAYVLEILFTSSVYTSRAKKTEFVCFYASGSEDTDFVGHNVAWVHSNDDPVRRARVFLPGDL